MPLDIKKGLTTIHIRFVTSDTNEATFFTHVDSCAGMNVGNLKLHQWIITTNPYIVEIYIQFDDENPVDPICSNCALDQEKNNSKGTLTSVVTYITHYTGASKKNHPHILWPQ